MSQHKIDFASIPWQAPIPGARSKSVVQGNRRLRLAEYTKKMQPHWCEKGHIGYILDGQFEIRFESEVLVFEPGDGVFIPAGRDHRHMARALSEVVRAVFVEEV